MPLAKSSPTRNDDPNLIFSKLVNWVVTCQKYRIRKSWFKFSFTDHLNPLYYFRRIHLCTMCHGPKIYLVHSHNPNPRLLTHRKPWSLSLHFLPNSKIQTMSTQDTTRMSKETSWILTIFKILNRRDRNWPAQENPWHPHTLTCGMDLWSVLKLFRLTRKWDSGHGTYVDNEEVIASVAGTIERVNKLVTVRAIRSRWA